MVRCSLFRVRSCKSGKGNETIEEAQRNLKEAVELYLESFEIVDLPESMGEIFLYPLEIVVNG